MKSGNSPGPRPVAELWIHMTWIETVPTLLIAVAIIFVPGAILARVLGARGITWLALAAPLSISLIGVGAIAAKMVHIPWTPVALILVTVAASVVCWLARFFIEIRRQKSVGPLWMRPSRAVTASLIGALILGFGVISLRLINIFINPENISQTYDNVFHLNAIRFIMDSGNGSSLYLGNLTQASSFSFYPAAWHDLVALVAQASGSSIPVSVNAVNMILAAGVWTISAMYLATRALGSRPAVYLLTGALAGAFSAFPYLILGFGVLYPNFLAITLMPVVLGLILDVLRLAAPATEPSSAPGTIRALILLILALPGVALAHPNIALAVGAFAVPIIVWWFLRLVKASVEKRLAWRWVLAAALGLIAYLVVLNFVWARFRPSAKASFWPPIQTIPQALGEAVANAPMGRPISWLIVALTVVGIYALVRKVQNLWLLGVLGVGIYFFIVASSYVLGDQRSSITGVFYNDSYRLAALLPVAGLTVAVVGAVWIFDNVCAILKISADGDRRRWLATMSVATVAVLAVCYLAQNVSVTTAQNLARDSYIMSPDAPLLSTDEAALLSRIDKDVPENVTIIGNPATGASLVYAFANRTALLPAVGSTPDSDDSTLTVDLGQLDTNPAVCDAVRKNAATYVLDFGSLQVNNLENPFPSSDELAALPGLSLVDHQGDAKLYKITACTKP